MIDDEKLDKIVNNPAFYCTDTQYKFYLRAKNEYKIIFDMKTYQITRGRGWSKRDGSCGASVVCPKNHTYYLLFYPLRDYLRKNITWVFYETGRNVHGNEYIGIELDGKKKENTGGVEK